MKWFKKLFRGKCAKQSEQILRKPESKKNLFDSLKRFKHSDRSASSALCVSVPVRSEIFALTTLRNFRVDSLDEFVHESNWVLLTKEQLEEPRFQQQLTRSDSLTSLCQSLSERSLDIRRAEIVAKPPNCQCKERDPEDVYHRPRKNVFRRFCHTLRTIWRHLCKKIKQCFFKPKMTTPKVDEDPSQSYTNIYLCR